MAESLQCHLCEEFLVEPKDLPCKHSFCRSCLQTHCLKNANGDSFPCPECQKSVKVVDPNAPIMEWIDAIPTNLAIAKRLEKVLLMEKEKKSELRKCMFCMYKYKAVRATKYCKSCIEYFCDECGNQHWLLRSSKEHRVWLIDDLAALKRETPIRARLVIMFNNNQVQSHVKTKPVTEKENVDPDKLVCEITGATFLDNGCVVTIDNANDKMKLFDKQYHQIASRVVRQCHDIVAINQYFVVVSCPETRCLKIFSIYEKNIEEERAIQTDSNCYGLCRVDENFAVGLSGIPAFLLIYGGRKLLETVKIEAGKVLLTKPHYITYSTKNQQFYVSDSTNRCLKCFTKKGSLVWERNIKECRGLAMFEEHVIIARSDRKTVDIINEKGQIIKSVVNADDGLSKIQVLCIDVWKTVGSSKRLVVADESSLVRVFVIEDPFKDDDLRVYFSKEKSIMSANVANEDEDNDKKSSRVCLIL